VLLQQRTANLERPLSYALPEGLQLGIGDVVRVPLGPREVYGYVVTEPYEVDEAAVLRPVAARAEGAPAFDAAALEVARWLAERYCCSLHDALAPVVQGGALPRVVDRFVPAGAPAPERFPALPPRLLRLIAGDLREGFGLDALLRHPEARRAGDRRTLLSALSALVRAGALRRTRTFVAPRIAESSEKVLEATGVALRGPRVRALLARVEAEGTLRRRDARLAGFSQATIARALREGGLRESTRAVAPRIARGPSEAHDFAATVEQATAIAAIVASVERGGFEEFLLQGITGSGKTFVYIQAIARTLELGGRAIVLVPEIALTPQTARRFEGAFGERVVVLHSGLSERERFDGRLAAARGDVDVVVGPRSALFAPLPNLRLIAIDEAHERTYKQESVPRYEAAEVARARLRANGGTLVLGSATPPLEAYAAALRGEVTHLRLRSRAGEAGLPATHLVDMAREFERGNRKIFSTRLVEALGERLERGEKSLLFVNRRGSAGFALCRTCGAVPECARCSLSLTVHRAEHLLRCHQCDAQAPLPATCAQCGSPQIREFGVGTQKVVEVAQTLFPRARIVRMDSDTTTRVGDHARLLDEFAERGDILVGTQMIAKGHDFAEVTLAGVVAADLGLHAPDFRAAERTFDLVTQVAGRSGRARPGEAIVQTYSPAHPALAFAAQHDYDGFAAWELTQRRELGYPPFGELIYLGIIGRRREAVVAAAVRYAELLGEFADVEVLGPAPYPVARVNDEWRYRIALKTGAGPGAGAALRAFLRERLLPLAQADRVTRLALNVDP
jgi:primosomal protein N' (replication factor Y) (superfamily II helicase)